jgi:hypothetical protein
MRHANMDEYNSVGPCAYSMCMMIELRSALAQLSRLCTCAVGLAVRPAAVRWQRPRCAVAAAFSLLLVALVLDRIFWQFFTISPAS